MTPSLAEAAPIAASAPAKMMLSFDTETTGVEWWDPAQRAFLATVAIDSDEAALEAPTWKHFTDAGALVAHNLSFDWHMLRATWGIDLAEAAQHGIAEFHDTDVMARLLYPSGQFDEKGEYVGYKLKQLARVHLDPNADTEEKELDEAAKALGYQGIKPPRTHKGPWRAYYDVWDAYPEVLLKYALQDARITYDLAQKFLPQLRSNERLWRLYQLEMAVTPILVAAETQGTRVDPERVVALHAEYETREAGMRERLLTTHRWPAVALGGEGSKEALLTQLTETMGIPLHRKTEHGALKTDKFALQEFADEFPALGDFLEWRTIEKFLSTYIEPLRGREVVHPSFRQIGAWTGRMSCARPNMQNIPVRAGSEVRDVFVASPGYKLVVSDYDSIEVRLLAYYLGERGEAYRELIRQGHDPHAYMADELDMAGVPGYDLGVGNYTKDSPGEKKRGQAKHTMFAITYGAGAPRVADMNQMDKGDARVLIKAIKTSLPGYFRLMDRLKQKVMTAGYVQTIGGRISPVKREKAYVALNAVIQGSAADIMKMGLVKVASAIAPLGGIPLLVVHDEVISEVPSPTADEALERQNAAMEAAFDLDPPLVATGKIVNRYGEAK